MHKTGIYRLLLNYYKGQSVHTTGSKGSEKEKSYRFTFSLTLCVEGGSVRGQRKAPEALGPENRPGIHYMRGLVYRKKTSLQRITPKMPDKAGA